MNEIMLHKKLVSVVKYNKTFLKAYRLLGNILIATLKMFTKVDNKKILFMSFGGQKYDDSPRALYESMKQDEFFKDYTFVWGFTDPSNYEYVDCDKVKLDTISFYRTALSSAIWINNSSVSRGLNLKQRGIFEVNTWHGTPLKKMGDDIKNNVSYFEKATADSDVVYCAQSEYDQKIFEKLFRTDKKNIIISDLPRNDSLLSYSKETIQQIKYNLNIDSDKKVILYAPTFREYDRSGTNACYIKPPMDLKKWVERLGEEYVILFRAHYEIIHVLGIEDNQFMRNVSSYPCLNDLMVISDMLISDYSSIYFDYSILEKPMFNFSYDYDIYCEKRGLYLDLKEVLPCNINYTEETLIEELVSYDPLLYGRKVKEFKQRFCPNAGNAVNIVIDIIKQHLGV